LSFQDWNKISVHQAAQQNRPDFSGFTQGVRKISRRVIAEKLPPTGVIERGAMLFGRDIVSG
jgi:hypothetical protein